MQCLSLNFSNFVVIAFILEIISYGSGLKQTALVVLRTILSMVEFVHHLAVLLGKEGFRGPEKEKMGLVIISNINPGDKNWRRCSTDGTMDYLHLSCSKSDLRVAHCHQH